MNEEEILQKIKLLEEIETGLKDQLGNVQKSLFDHKCLLGMNHCNHCDKDFEVILDNNICRGCALDLVYGDN